MEESGERVVDKVDNIVFTADLIINRGDYVLL